MSFPPSIFGDRNSETTINQGSVGWNCMRLANPWDGEPLLPVSCDTLSRACQFEPPPTLEFHCYSCLRHSDVICLSWNKEWLNNWNEIVTRQNLLSYNDQHRCIQRVVLLFHDIDFWFSVLIGKDETVRLALTTWSADCKQSSNTSQIAPNNESSRPADNTLPHPDRPTRTSSSHTATDVIFILRVSRRWFISLNSFSRSFSILHPLDCIIWSIVQVQSRSDAFSLTCAVGAGSTSRNCHLDSGFHRYGVGEIISHQFRPTLVAAIDDYGG